MLKALGLLASSGSCACRSGLALEGSLLGSLLPSLSSSITSSAWTSPSGQLSSSALQHQLYFQPVRSLSGPSTAACQPSSSPSSSEPALAVQASAVETSGKALLPASSRQSGASTSAASALKVSPFPPVYSSGPLTVQYPFPIEYYQDREVVVYGMGRSAPKGLQLLPGPVFNVPVRIDVLHRVVRWLRASWQQGTHKAKTRSEVRGGGRKPWPQKGTGRARHGSIRSPIFVGGGVAHPPRPRSHAHDLPLPVQLLGYKCALSAKATEGRLVVADSLRPQPAGMGQDGKPVIKTKATLQQLQELLKPVSQPYETVLLVDCGETAADGGEELRRGARNLPWVSIMSWQVG